MKTNQPCRRLSINIKNPSCAEALFPFLNKEEIKPFLEGFGPTEEMRERSRIRKIVKEKRKIMRNAAIMH